MTYRHLFPITLCWSLFLLLLFALGLANNWFGAPAGAGDVFCEVNDGLIKQPANTWSNLGFIFAGLLMAYQMGRPGFSVYANPMSKRVFYALFFSCLTVFLGPGSMAMHATTSRIGGFLDMLSMYLIASFLVAYGSMRLFKWSEWNFGLVFTLVLSICIWANFQHFTMFFGFAGNFAFAVFVTTGAVLEILHNRLRKVEHDLWWGVSSVAAILLALFIWGKSMSRGPWCDPSSLVQGHAAWHLLDAYSVYGLFRFYWSERSI